MTRARAILYSILFVLAVGSAALGRRYLDRLNVHDYGRRGRASVAETVQLEESQLRRYLDTAIDSRIEPIDGQPTLEIRSGWCLMARRAEQGLSPTPRDKLVTAALLWLWLEPWVQQYSADSLPSLKRRYLDVDDHKPSVESLRGAYLDGLVSLPPFRDAFRQALTQAAHELQQPIEWQDQGGA